MLGSIASIVASEAASAIEKNKRFKEAISKMNPEQREFAIAQRDRMHQEALKRMEARELERQSTKSGGFGMGALFLAFLFGSSL